MNVRTRTLLVFLATLAVEVLFLIAVGGFSRPLWGDEGHFVDTVHSFMNHSVTIADYPEVTPPFMYLLYAAWGLIFGGSLVSLRLFSLLLGATASVLQYHLIRRFLGDGWKTWLGTAYLVVFPYFIGSGVFVYTDMLFQVVILAAVHLFLSRRPLWFMLAAAVALLTRQYAIFLLVVSGIHGLQLLRKGNLNQAVWWLGGTQVAFLPLGILMLVWGGLAPPLGRELWIVQNGTLWNPHAFSTMVTFTGFYALPFIIYSYKQIRVVRAVWYFLLPVGLFYGLFPVEASRVTVQQLGISTVGLLHKLLVAILPQLVVDVLLVLGYLSGVLVLRHLVISLRKKWAEGWLKQVSIVDLLITAYLLIMPLSYQTWEKYLLPVLPLIAVRLLMARVMEKD